MKKVVLLFGAALAGLSKYAHAHRPLHLGETGKEEAKNLMYAIVRNGSKQYKVEEGSVVKFEKLDAAVGDTVEFETVLFADENGVVVGTPVVENVTVKGEVLAQDKFRKVIVYKFKAKKNERKKQGHRQPFTAVKILSIAAK